MANTLDIHWPSAAPPSQAQVEYQAEAAHPLPGVAQYGLTLLLVAAATLLAFVADHVVAAPNLTLIFVLPVVIAATNFGWGPSVAGIVASVLAFDFFFTRPYLTLRMTDPGEIWAAGLLLITATIVSTVAAQSRRGALETRRGADQAAALQMLAHAVMEKAPQRDILQTAATTLGRIFAAPAVIYSHNDGRLVAEVTAGGAVPSSADAEAAKCALEARTHMKGETYPNDDSSFDFWPIITPTGRYVVGVNLRSSVLGRPDNPERFVQIVGALIASGSGPAPSSGVGSRP